LSLLRKSYLVTITIIEVKNNYFIKQAETLRGSRILGGSWVPISTPRSVIIQVLVSMDSSLVCFFVFRNKWQKPDVKGILLVAPSGIACDERQKKLASCSASLLFKKKHVHPVFMIIVEP
jgi:hypothetical protein